MNTFSVVFLIFAMTKTAISYRDYPVSRMPDYDLNYDVRESRTRPDYSKSKIIHVDDDDDYKDYVDEDDSSKLTKESYDEDIKPKRLSHKATKEEIDSDLYIEEDFKQRKTIRDKNTDFDSEDDHKNMKYSRSHNFEDDIDIEVFPPKEDDYKERDQKNNARYNHYNRKARRKPRDRPIKVILPDTELVRSINEKNVRPNIRKDTENGISHKEDIAKKMIIEAFDDMKKVNDFKGNLPLIIRQPVNMTEFATSKVLPHRRASKIDTISVTISDLSATTNLPNIMTPKMEVANKSEMSLAERSRLSILKKIQKKENSNITKTTKPPILMQVTNKMQTMVLVESNNLANDIKKVRRVMDDNPEMVEKAKHLMRQKLIANARSIDDLTGNWDELICDYIDVNLLNSSSFTSFYSVLYCLELMLFVMFQL